MSSLIVHLSMAEFCEIVGVPATLVIEIVEHGIVQPEGQLSTPETWLFDHHALIMARRAKRLQRELDLEWAAIALALQLMDEVAGLRQENLMLKQRLGRFLSVG